MGKRHLTSTMSLNTDRGASGLFIAACIFLLMGMAAIVIDGGSGFTERRQDVTAADTGVMAGALDFNDQPKARDEVLGYVRRNLSQVFGNPADPNDPAWVAIWQGCADPGRPIGFFPVTEPVAWGGGTIDCISQSESFLRVRVPDQLQDTTFGAVIGFNQLATSAFAVATLQPGEAQSPIIPFGIVSTATNGAEICLSSAPPGNAQPPCSGSSSGTFGTLNSQFWGNSLMATAVDCQLPGQIPQLAQNIAIGIDHFIGLHLGVLSGPHPGDNNLPASAHNDDCNVVSSDAVAQDGVPLNTVRVDTGFPQLGLRSGLVSEDTFAGGRLSRLQQGTNPKRTIQTKISGNIVNWDLDNKPLWQYLVAGSPSVVPSCSAGAIAAAADTNQAMTTCLIDYASSGATAPIFDTTIDTSPRFAWAPQFWYSTFGTGTTWQPVMAYRMVYLGGTWFNCQNAAGGKICDSAAGVVFYPGMGTASMCELGGGGCKALSVDQLSAWLLPDNAIPEEIRLEFPGGPGAGPFAPSLWR